MLLTNEWNKYREAELYGVSDSVIGRAIKNVRLKRGE